MTAIVAESPEAAIWSKESYLKLGEETGSLALVSETDGAISGFLVGRQVGDQAEVLNLAVAARRRRTGEVDGHAGGGAGGVSGYEARGACISKYGNQIRAAIEFYEKHGFARTGRRKGYYRDAGRGGGDHGEETHRLGPNY